MKIITVITLFLILSACGNRSSNPTIGTPKRIGKLEVAEKNFTKVMNWDDAKAACEMLDDGWRLPTLEELVEIYQNKDQVGVFPNGRYWSSKETDGEYGYFQDFNNGKQDLANKFKTFYVRAVRTF